MATKNKKSEIRKLIHSSQHLTWINITDADPAAMNYLNRTFHFHHLDLDDCLLGFQRPKIDDYDDYLFLVLHVPIRHQYGEKIHVSEVNIFIGQNFLVTIHKDDEILNSVFESCRLRRKMKDEYMNKGAGYLLYMIIDDLFENSMTLLNSFDRQIAELEKDVFDSDHTKDCLREILLLKKDIINFRRIIIPERAIIAQLEQKDKKFLPESLNVYFDDIVDKIEKMWNTLENLQELINSLQETNESIISHNTNNIIKVLTIFSVVMMPLTLITGFYGMNVEGLPLADHPAATIILASGLFLIVVVMIIYFKRRRWM